MFTSCFGVLSVIQSSDRIFRLPGSGLTIAVISTVLATPVTVGLLPLGQVHMVVAITGASPPRQPIWPTPSIGLTVCLSAASKNLHLSGGTYSFKN